MTELFNDANISSQAKADADAAIRKAQVPSFESFWAVWPKREAKKDARRAWDKLSNKDKFAAMAALPAHINRWKREGRARNHIPHPATWLRGERWEDELGEIFKPKQPAYGSRYQQPEPEEKPWPCSWSGIVAKGKELGLSQLPDELPPVFKERVYAAAGLTASDKAKLLADYGVRV